MKKTILTLAIALMSMGSLSALAQTQSETQNNVTIEQKCDKPNCPKKDKKDKKDKKGSKDFKKGGKDLKCPKQAQGECKKSMKGGKRNPLMQGIELTADQQTKVDKIYKDFQNDRQQLKTKEREQMTKLREKENKEILKVLTPEQQAQFNANQTKMQERMQKKMADGSIKMKGSRKMEGRKDSKKRFDGNVKPVKM